LTTILDLTVGQAVALGATTFTVLGGVATFWWKSARAYAAFNKLLESKADTVDLKALEHATEIRYREIEQRLFQRAEACAECRREVDESIAEHKQAVVLELHKKAAKVDLLEIIAAQRELTTAVTRLQADLGNVLALVQETRQDVRELMRGGRGEH